MAFALRYKEWSVVKYDRLDFLVWGLGVISILKLSKMAGQIAVK